jgi:hypothetical protein
VISSPQNLLLSGALSLLICFRIGPAERHTAEQRLQPVLPSRSQLRAARALLGMPQIELSKRSRVAIGTIRRMEAFDGEIGARTSTLSQVQKALEKAGVEFLNDGQPGVRLNHVPR